MCNNVWSRFQRESFNLIKCWWHEYTKENITRWSCCVVLVYTVSWLGSTVALSKLEKSFKFVVALAFVERRRFCWNKEMWCLYSLNPHILYTFFLTRSTAFLLLRSLTLTLNFKANKKRDMQQQRTWQQHTVQADCSLWSVVAHSNVLKWNDFPEQQHKRLSGCLW